MKLVHKSFPESIEVDENCVLNLVIESPVLFREFVKDFVNQAEGNEGNWIISKDGNIHDIKKSGMVINNYFDLNINSKKILSKLYLLLQTEIYETEQLLSWKELETQIYQFTDGILPNIPYSVTYNEKLEISHLFEYIQLKFQIEGTELIEQLIDYIKIYQEIVKTSIVVLVNAKAYLDHSEIEELYKFCIYQKILLILLEDTERKYSPHSEKVIILDEDCCVIQKEMS